MNELLEFSKEINFNFEFYDFKNNKIVKFNRVGEMEGVSGVPLESVGYYPR